MASIAHRPRNTSKPYAVRYRDESGRQREASFRTKTEATRFMTEINHGKQNGSFTDPKAGDIRFMDYAATVLTSYAASEGTIGVYTQMLNTWVSGWANGRSITQVANDRSGVTQLVNVTMTRNGELMSFNRRGIALTVIKMVLNEAVANKLIASHAMNGIKIRHSETVKASKHDDFVFPSHDLVSKLASEMDGYSMAIWLCRGAGLRIGEALAVEKSDFIDNGKVLRVTRQAHDDGSKAIPLKHRRPGQFRDVPVPGYLWEMVRNLPDGVICKTDGSQAYHTYNTVQKKFRRVSDALGIESGFTLHSLRHAWATALLTRNVPIHAVSQWLGHSDVAVTSKIYAHVLPSSVTDARGILDNEFSTWSGGSEN